MARTMKAWVQTDFGGPEMRSLMDVPIPLPAADEVLVKIKACALNRLDVLQRRQPVVPTFRLPHIGGMDMVGEVVESAAPENNALVGRLVVIDPVVTCGQCDRCQAGLEAYCRNFRTCGSSRDGGLAEYLAVPAGNCITIETSHATAEEFACVPVASVTAWHGLLAAGKIKSGETIVIPGGGSGVGIAGIQIAKAQGCKVVALVKGEAKMERACALGADLVVDRAAGDWVAAVMDYTMGAGADMVWDHVGGPFLQQAIDACRLNGRVVLSGTTAGNQSTIVNTSLFHWGKSLIGHGGYSVREMRDTVAAYCAGRLRVIVDSRWSFADLPAAERRLESDDFFGKILVCM